MPLISKNSINQHKFGEPEFQAWDDEMQISEIFYPATCNPKECLLLSIYYKKPRERSRLLVSIVEHSHGRARSQMSQLIVVNLNCDLLMVTPA